jgi:hypothetical protein
MALFHQPSELFVPITALAALVPELANDVLHQHNAKNSGNDMPQVWCNHDSRSRLDTVTRHLGGTGCTRVGAR